MLEKDIMRQFFSFMQASEKLKVVKKVKLQTDWILRQNECMAMAKEICNKREEAETLQKKLDFKRDELWDLIKNDVKDFKDYDAAELDVKKGVLKLKNLIKESEE